MDQSSSPPPSASRPPALADTQHSVARQMARGAVLGVMLGACSTLLPGLASPKFRLSPGLYVILLLGMALMGTLFGYLGATANDPPRR